MPYGRMLARAGCALSGSKYSSTFSPSKGAKGSKLKSHSVRLRKINSTKNCPSVGKMFVVLLRKGETPKKRKGMAPTKARKKLENGPAKETIITPALLLRRMTSGFIGTGFAQPKPNRISSSVPIGSRWLSGLRVSLPAKRGVSSP